MTRGASGRKHTIPLPVHHHHQIFTSKVHRLSPYLGEIFQAVEVVIFPWGGHVPPLPRGVSPVQPSEVVHPLSGRLDRRGEIFLAVHQLQVRKETNVNGVVGAGGRHMKSQITISCGICAAGDRRAVSPGLWLVTFIFSCDSVFSFAPSRLVREQQVDMP